MTLEEAKEINKKREKKNELRNTLKELNLSKDKERIISILKEANSFLNEQEIETILQEVGLSEYLEKSTNTKNLQESSIEEKIISIQKEMSFTLQEISINSRKTVFWIKFWSIYFLICIGLAIILWIYYIHLLSKYPDLINY
ncbi:MAG: hypothetical protein IJ180_10240 [Bacteroidales bacterium]|nr:hypothetical protein [Bacteroidales bacterium]